MPTQLPKGSTGQLLRWNTEYYPPVLLVDMAIRDASGSPVSDLAMKDVSVSQAGRDLPGIRMAAVNPSRSSLADRPTHRSQRLDGRAGNFGRKSRCQAVSQSVFRQGAIQALFVQR